MACSNPTFPRRWQATIRPSTRMPTVCSHPGESICLSSPTTPSSSGARGAQKLGNHYDRHSTNGATLGWGYFEKLAKQRVMQLQSAADPPKKVAAGERAVQVDGADYTILQFQEKGEPVEIVYASEATPLISGPAAIMTRAPNPNAARLFYSWAMSLECQQLNSDTTGLRSAHALVAERKGRKPLAEIKVMKEDPAAVEALSDQIKAKYTAIFGVLMRGCGAEPCHRCAATEAMECSSSR